MSVQSRLLDELREFDRRHPGCDLTLVRCWVGGSDRGRGPGESLYAYVAEGFAFEIPLDEPQSHEAGAAEVGPTG